MKKRLTIILVSLTFLPMFFYFYRKSGKFRQSIIAALLAALVLSSGPLESEAKGVDAFSPQQQTTHSQRNRSFSSRAARKPNNGGPGKPDNSRPGGDDDNGMPQYPKAESVQETENRVDNIDEYIARMEESSDSEEEECEATAGSYNYIDVMRELDKQSNKKIITVQVAGQTYMIENADRMGVDQLENKLAEQMYNSIRENDKDISDIAVYTKIKADNIKKCKDHVFYNEHVLDRYVHLGDDPVVQRFDPDLKQALAWKRFEIGEHTPEDMEWLKHEYAERYIEPTYDAGYTESHDRAQSHFDENPWNDD